MFKTFKSIFSIDLQSKQNETKICGLLMQISAGVTEAQQKALKILLP